MDKVVDLLGAALMAAHRDGTLGGLGYVYDLRSICGHADHNVPVFTGNGVVIYGNCSDDSEWFLAD
jgi:hypothetical protein